MIEGKEMCLYPPVLNKLCHSHQYSFVFVFNFIYFWLRWVFVSSHGLYLVAACELLVVMAPLVAEPRF